MKSVLQSSQKEKTDLLTQRIQFRVNADNDKSSNYLMAIQTAITDFKLLKIVYQSLENKRSECTIEPFAIYSTQENWLLIAFYRLRNNFRAFRIDAIQKLTVQNEIFEPHNMTLEKYFEPCREKNVDTPDTPLT